MLGFFWTKEEKTDPIGAFVHRALKICSPKKLFTEVKKIKNTNNLQQIGYPEVITSGIKKFFKF